MVEILQFHVEILLLFRVPDLALYVLRFNSFSGLTKNIDTSSVFCYDKHKKNFDIHFSMKRQAIRMSQLF